MAKLLPDIRNFKPLSAGEHTERELLLQLQEGLPDTYTVFHHLHVTMARAVGDQHGELDVVVMNRAGDLATLEIKAGELTLDQGGVFKRYGNAVKDVGQQSRRQFGQLLERIRQRGWQIRLHHYLTLPHQRVAPDDESLSYPRERIIDSEQCRDLPGEIQRRLGSGMDDPQLREDIQRFMLNWLGLSLDVTALSQRLGQQVRAISGGLATWVPRIHAPSGVVRVRATAGSGKTQLALRLLEEAAEKRQRAAYVCFNRPLADHLAEIAPGRKQGVEVMTFHQLCWEHAGRPAAGSLDFNQVTSAYLADAGTQAADLDMLVIDEMQDMHAEWVQALLTRLKAAGRLYVLEDPDQCLYRDREEIEIADAVVVTSRENHRSPRSIVQMINLLALSDEPIEACSPYPGELPTFRTYTPGDGSLQAATSAAVEDCLGQGFSLDDIVVLTWRGREHSELHQDRLGPWQLRRFDGTYDEQGRPHWTDGALTIDTVRRFKGQASAALVLTEVDFDRLNLNERSMLLVSLTRARVFAQLVLSSRAELALQKSIKSHGQTEEIAPI